MKKRISTFPLLTFLFFMTTTALQAQENTDVITMLNGDQKQGKVTAVADDHLMFKYAGEDLEYEIKKSKINKIDFASGRTEVINEPPQAAAPTPVNSSSAADRRNKLAVLPFDFVSNDPALEPESMSRKVQMDCIGAFRDEVHALLKVQDPMTTNALLSQHNVPLDQIRAIAPKDMAIMLGVEYVVYGTADIENKGTRSFGTSSTTYKDKETRKYDNRKRDSKSSGREFSSESSSTTIEYDERISLNIYNDEGNSVFSDSKRPFGSGVDAYTSSLKFLVKRTPFGSKYKG